VSVQGLVLANMSSICIVSGLYFGETISERVGYVLAPPFWRRRFGAAVLAPCRFGAGCFGAAVLAPAN